MASKERRRERYAEDPAYREEQLAASRRFYQANKKKISERKRRWRKENPEYREKEVIRQRKKALESYGGSLEQYNRMLAEQDGKCKLCRQRPRKRSLCADHCHKRVKLRALLCTNCNSMFGFSGDNPDRLEEGARLLREFLRNEGEGAPTPAALDFWAVSPCPSSLQSPVQRPQTKVKTARAKERSSR
jgi:hypothetical protein